MLPPLPVGTKFDITSCMIQMLNIRRLSACKETDDAHMYLTNFTSVCKSNCNRPEVSPEAMELQLFPLSLKGEATLWLDELLNNSITTWRELREAFLERFFPPSNKLLLKDEIYNFR